MDVIKVGKESDLDIYTMPFFLMGEYIILHLLPGYSLNVY